MNIVIFLKFLVNSKNQYRNKSIKIFLINNINIQLNQKKIKIKIKIYQKLMKNLENRVNLNLINKILQKKYSLK